MAAKAVQASVRLPSALAGASHANLSRCSWEILWFSLELPFSACATLQTLHLLPTTWLLSFHTLSSVGAVIFIDQVPSLPKSPNVTDITAFCISCAVHPLVLSYLLDQFRESLQSGLQGIIRHSIPVPDEPDFISDKYEKSNCHMYNEESFRASMPGFGWDVDAKRRYYGPKSFSESLRMAFAGVSKLTYAITGFPLPLKPHLTPETEVALKQLCDLRYGVLWRENRQFTEAQRLPDSIVRRRAVEEALSKFGVDPALDAISIDDWSSRWISDRSNDDSTTTPDPQDLFPAARGDEANFASEALINEGRSSPTVAADTTSPDGPATQADTTSSNIALVVPEEPTSRTSDVGEVLPTAADVVEHFQQSIPLETLLLPMDAENHTQPSTPIPGISRAPSLDQALLRPVRRPTDIGPDTESELLPWLNRPFDSASLPEDVIEEPDDPIQHRVTWLSCYPAEVFTFQASTLLTSLLMLPLDMFYHRTLARAFLGSSRMTNPAARRMQENVWPTNPWLGVGAMGLWGGCVFVKNLALTFSVQAVASSLVWYGSKRFALSLGRGYGWGKI